MFNFSKLFFKEKTYSPLKRKPLRYPGQSLDEDIRKVQDKIDEKLAIFFYFLGTVVVIWFTYFADKKSIFIVALVFSLFLILIFAYLIGLIFSSRKKVKDFELGRDGEKEVAGFLDSLKKEGVHIFHDVINEDKTFNIDHVVISPHGVFTIETKTYRKPKNPKIPSEHGATIKYDGHNIIKDGYNAGNKIIKQAQGQVNWLKNKLNVDVFAIVVFPKWWVEKNTKNNITVINPEKLKKHIESRKQILSVEESNGIYKKLYNYVRVPSDD